MPEKYPIFQALVQIRTDYSIRRYFPNTNLLLIFGISD